MGTESGSTNLGASVNDGHVAWFWRQVARGAEGVSVAELAAHVTPDAWCQQLSLSSPGAFSRSVQTGVYADATLGDVSVDEHGRILTSFVTRRGLRLQATFLSEAADDGRIRTIGLRLEGGASMTAVLMAAMRAAHSLLDEPKVLDDSVAEGLAGEFAAGAIASVRADPTTFFFRHTAAARARLAEDTASGADQYVLLGAGLDSFAYRRGDASDGLRIFEVDQPITQSWKRQRLADIGVTIPESVTFVPLDFEQHDLDLELSRAGFDPAKPSVVAWLGVTYYLTPEAITGTLERIAHWSAGTQIVFDYQIPEPMWDSFEGWDDNLPRAVAAGFAASGEPWVSSFSPAEVETLLSGHGYGNIEDFDHDMIRAAYMGSVGSGLPGPIPWVRVVRASVIGRPG
jgi:methyltransferase (TIGR00027 family)